MSLWLFALCYWNSTVAFGLLCSAVAKLSSGERHWEFPVLGPCFAISFSHTNGSPEPLPHAFLESFLCCKGSSKRHSTWVFPGPFLTPEINPRDHRVMSNNLSRWAWWGGGSLLNMDHATNRAQVKECQIESTWVFTDLLRHPGNAQGPSKIMKSKSTANGIQSLWYDIKMPTSELLCFAGKVFCNNLPETFPEHLLRFTKAFYIEN